ncbi:hypothetical protein [Bacillus cereus]|uniref:hypothetical protein n=1 Tax=Bacillus cereus TaxID=1396 RepID=UPI0039811CE9
MTYTLELEKGNEESENCNMKAIKAIKAKLQLLLDQDIHSVSELKKWLAEERELNAEIEEVVTKRLIDFYNDTSNEVRRQQ